MKPYLVHITDIFHPHGDPDDHFDLALAFALHKLGCLELGRVICDYPPAHRVGDPALCAVAQLNEITGSDVRACVSPSDPDRQAQLVLSVLREAPRPVNFTVVGSTEHIAEAIRKEPELFAEKCAGIWLAAGSGIETPGGILEYNVRLHPTAYTTTLSAPCPVHWTPCYHTIVPGESLFEKGGEYGSVFCLEQREILPLLPPAVQKYFLYMLTRSEDPKYLRYLNLPVDTEALAFFGDKPRRLWSTPMLLSIAGIACETYEYLPVKLECSEGGHVSWTAADSDSDKQIFHIKNCDRQGDDSFDMTGSYRKEMIGKLIEICGKM